MKQMFWTAAVLASASVLSGCISFPPHYDKNPHVKVEYEHVTILPGSENALFIKKVTQVITKPSEDWSGIPPFMTSSWSFHETPIWTRMFICSANIETGEKKVIREWPHELSEPTDKGWYVVSRPLHRAAFHEGPAWGGNIVVMNLDTFDWSYIKHPNSPYSRPSPYAVAVSPDEKEFAVPIHTVYAPNGSSSPRLEGVAVCSFEGAMRFVPLEDSPGVIQWLQRRNTIRGMVGFREFVWINPVTLTVEIEKYERYRDIPADEDKPPLNVQYPSRTVNLGTPGDYKGRLSPSEAPTLW